MQCRQKDQVQDYLILWVVCMSLKSKNKFCGSTSNRKHSIHKVQIVVKFMLRLSKMSIVCQANTNLHQNLALHFQRLGDFGAVGEKVYKFNVIVNCDIILVAH